MICAPDGGVLDDLIVYRLADTEFLVVANAANTAVVAAALRERAAGHQAQVDDKTDDYALIAIQGPHAARILAPLTDIGLDQVRYYAGQRAVVAGRDVLLARTGYTGEDGFELFTSPGDAEPLWLALTAAGEADGLVPAGLAARDTLRLEAGMPLYGNELGTEMTPFDAGLGRVVVFDKPGDFVGRAALAERAAGRAAAGPGRADRRLAPGPPARLPGALGRPAPRDRHQRRPLPHPRRADRHGLPGPGRRATGGRGRRAAAGGGHPRPRRASPPHRPAVLPPATLTS